MSNILSSMQLIASQMAVKCSELQQTAYEYVEALLVPAQILCGIFAFVYIGMRLWSSWSRGEKIDFYGMIRPFSVGLLVCFFAAFVSVLQVVVKPIETAAASLSESVYEPYVQAQNDYLQATVDMRNSMAAYERKEAQDNAQVVEEHITASSSNMQTYRMVVDLLAQFTQLGISGMVYFVQLYVVLAQLILLLIGPFAFALSLLPGFSGNIKHWMAHFLHLSLYKPLCLLVGFMVAMLFSQCIYPVFIDMINELPTAEYSFSDYEMACHVQFSIQLLFVLFNSVAIALYACIPTFSKWIISSDGASGWLVASKND